MEHVKGYAIVVDDKIVFVEYVPLEYLESYSRELRSSGHFIRRIKVLKNKALIIHELGKSAYRSLDEWMRF